MAWTNCSVWNQTSVFCKQYRGKRQWNIGIYTASDQQAHKVTTGWLESNHLVFNSIFKSVLDWSQKERIILQSKRFPNKYKQIKFIMHELKRESAYQSWESIKCLNNCSHKKKRNWYPVNLQNTPTN
jgi:hypothetical protein